MLTLSATAQRSLFELKEIPEIDIMGILATPPKATPPRNKALLRAY